jgi:hypothetical protein
MKQPRVFPRLFAGLVVSLSLALPAFALETFPDEAKAQQHCPKDVVVWLNLPTMIWHYKGQRWYANTIHGAYACEMVASHWTWVRRMRRTPTYGCVGKPAAEQDAKLQVRTARKDKEHRVGLDA